MMKRPIVSPFNSYHHTDSLLFQFVLFEFLRALEETSKLEAELKEDDTLEQVHLKLTKYLLHLAGSEQEYTRIFTWIYDSGVLTKLKNGVDLLSQKADKDDHEMRSLHLIVHKAWLECLHAVDLYRSQEKSLKAQVLKALKLIRKVPSALKKVIWRFEEDENVIFFLLRNQQKFNQLLGADFLKEFLHAETVPFLIEKYKARGFDPAVLELEALYV